MSESILRKAKLVVFCDSIFGLEIFFAPVMMAFYLHFVGLNFGQTSLFFSAILISSMIFEIPSGAFSDLFGRKKAFLLGKCIYLCSMGLLFFVKDFFALLFIAVLFSLGSSISSGNLSAIIFENLSRANIEKEDFLRITSKAGSIGFLISGLAAIIGGYIGALDIRLPLIIDMIFLIINIIIGFVFIEEIQISKIDSNAKTEYQNTYLKKFKLVFAEFFQILIEGIRISTKNKDILFVFLFSSISFAVLRTGFNYYQPIFEQMNIGLDVFGIILFIFNIVAALTSFILSKISNRHMNGHTLVYAIIFLMVLSGALFFVNSSYIVIAVLAFGFHQIIRGFSDSYASYLINKEISLGSGSRTTIISVLFFMRSIICAVFMSLSGIVAGSIGMVLTFTSLSLFGGILILLGLHLLKSKAKKEVQKSFS